MSVKSISVVRYRMTAQHVASPRRVSESFGRGPAHDILILATSSLPLTLSLLFLSLSALPECHFLSVASILRAIAVVLSLLATPRRRAYLYHRWRRSLSLSLSHGSMATRGDLRCRVPAQLLLPPPLVLSVQYPLEVIENGGRLELHLQVHEFRLTCHHGGYYPQAGRTVKSGNTNGSGSMCADCLLLLIRPRLRPVGLLPL
jgi:hypothetical protein